MEIHNPAQGLDLYNHPLTRKIIGCAIEVHRHLGPGLLESTYERCLCREMTLQGVLFQRQVPVPINYKNEQIKWGYHLDLFIEHFVVVELKAVNEIIPIHCAQILTYMKLLEAPLGLIINFNVVLLKQGIKKFTLMPSLVK